MLAQQWLQNQQLAGGVGAAAAAAGDAPAAAAAAAAAAAGRQLTLAHVPVQLGGVEQQALQLLRQAQHDAAARQAGAGR